MTKKAKIVILGYGSQGRAWALNLKDSGFNLLIGLPARSKSGARAKRDGFGRVLTTGKAVAEADIIIFAFPDHLQGRVFKKDILPNLKAGRTLIFLHGFSIYFKTVVPPKDCDIILLAPLAPGVTVRERFRMHETIGYFYSIHRNYSGKARGVLKTLANGLRIDRRKMIKTSFADEAIGDIFGEQAVLCGGLSQLIKAGYDTLVNAGLSSDKAYLEIGYQIDLIVDLIKKYGIEGMLRRISLAARYGSLLSGSKIIDRGVRRRMKKLLGEIKAGRFAAWLNALSTDDIKKLDRQLKKMTSPALERSARRFSSVKEKS